MASLLCGYEEMVKRLLGRLRVAGYSLGRFEKFNAFSPPALLQTQQAVLQESVGDQVVIVLDL